MIGEPDNFQPFGKLPKGFFISYLVFYFKKEGFLKDLLYNLIIIGLTYPGKEEL